MLNWLWTTDSSISQSTVSNAAMRSITTNAMITLDSTLHKALLHNLSSEVSQLWFALYADWYDGKSLCRMQC